MRLCNFGTPKRVKTPKGAQIGLNFVFPVFQVEIPQNDVHNPNLKRNG